MEPRNVILWILLPVLVVLAMSAGVQAQELREVPASEILEKIQVGEDMHLENVRIIGEFNLSKIKLETAPIVCTSVEIEWYSFKKGPKIYYGLVNELKIIESEITIIDSVFENSVDFSDTRFKKPVGFHGTSFLNISDFSGVSFDGYADFDHASFGGDADFKFADFDGDAYFGDASFGGDADFKFADFGGDADFGSASFGGDAYFGGAIFDGYADFAFAGFDGYALFGSTKFNKVSFYNTLFTHFLHLHDTDFKSMKVEWTSLKDTVHTPKFFDTVFPASLIWQEMSTFKDALLFDGPTYIKLIKNFREMEQFEDADDAYYQYRRLSQKNKRWSLSKLGDIFMWLSCGYGVKPWRTAAWAVAIILIFTPFYFWRGGIKRLKENNEDEKQDVPLYDAFYFSMTTFTTLGYGDLYPADRYRMVAVMIEGLVGWLILALFLVTLANVMIRP